MQLGCFGLESSEPQARERWPPSKWSLSSADPEWTGWRRSHVGLPPSQNVPCNRDKREKITSQIHISEKVPAGFLRCRSQVSLLRILLGTLLFHDFRRQSGSLFPRRRLLPGSYVRVCQCQAISPRGGSYLGAGPVVDCFSYC